ncbi:MAG: GNAT family N-acetyltransferase [Planctomycetes bacterium]|nr:GNAT family N-acetyltransferase [Planctomycetota bacterium]
MTTRPTRPADTPAIHALIDLCYREYDCVLRVELDEPHLVEPGPYFRATGGEFWVVEDDAGIIATCAVKIHPDSAELKTLYVHPRARRQGLGRELTELAMEFARAAGRNRFVLWSDTRFTKAHALYRSMGFVQEGERDLHDSNRSREYGFHTTLG